MLHYTAENYAQIILQRYEDRSTQVSKKVMDRQGTSKFLSTRNTKHLITAPVELKEHKALKR